MNEIESPAPPVLVPSEALSPEALDGIIDNFILREGTDYGSEEVTRETKIQRVRKQIEKSDVKIVYDPNTESVTLMTDLQWRKLSQTTPSSAATS
jgi:uncharacterized protein YheU (UPF0270 family)